MVLLNGCEDLLGGYLGKLYAGHVDIEQKSDSNPVSLCYYLLPRTNKYI